MANKFVTFDGSAGTYLSTDDVNLLDADTAHIQQGIGNWLGSRGTVTAVPGTGGNFGHVAFDVTAVDGAPRAQDTTTYSLAGTYTFSLDAKNLNAGSRDVRLRVNNVDSAPGSNGGTASVGAGATARIEITVNPTTDIDGLWAVLQNDYEIGDQWEFSNFVLREGTDPTFLPSYRIESDAEREFTASPVSWSPSGRESVMSDVISSQGGADFNIEADGDLRYFYVNSSGGNATATSTEPTGLVDGSSHVIKSQRFGGLLAFFVDGVQLGLDRAAVGGAQYAGSDFLIGARPGPSQEFSGDISDSIMRDGIGGPIVLRMDPDEIPFADGAIPDLSTWTDSSGRVWTSHGNVVLTTIGGAPIDVTYTEDGTDTDLFSTTSLTSRSFTEAGTDTDPFSTTSLAFRVFTEAGIDTDLFDAVLDVPGSVALTFTEASTDVDSFSVLHVVPPPPIDPDDPISETPIPPGTTWTDSTGRVWTSFGSLVMKDDSVQTVRQELIKFLRLHHSNWQFYDYPPEVLSTPAVLINPSDPYIEPFTQGPDGPSAVIWGIDLTLVTKRAQAQSSLLTLEFMFTEIQETLRLRPNIRWIDFSDVGSIEVAGVTYLSGVLSVAIMSTIDKTN